jgi:catechol 2,3-dioxygenase-like lactoylglutathione lyase family enzyme
MFSVHIVTVYVSDQDRALEFYVDRLGCELRVDRVDEDGVRFVEVAPPGGGTRLSLVQQHADHRAGGATGISLNADEIYAAHQTLTERGVKFIQTPTPRENGAVRSQFVDPDGNSFLLNQHPTRRPG